MSDKSWKKYERVCATAFGGERFWANSGERLDFEGPHVVGQCKEVKSMSLSELTALAEETAAAGKLKGKVGVVCAKLRRGAGRPSAPLVIMTMDQFTQWFDFKRREHDPAKVD